MRFSKRVDFNKLKQDVFSKIHAVYDQRLTGLINNLSRESYVGGTGNLARGWRYTRAKDSVNATVENIDPKATEKIRGNPPGTIVAVKDLVRWGKLNNMGAILALRRRIALVGTLRWISGDNFLMLGRDDQLKRGNPVEQAAEEIAKEINKLRFD